MSTQLPQTKTQISFVPRMSNTLYRAFPKHGKRHAFLGNMLLVHRYIGMQHSSRTPFSLSTRMPTRDIQAHFCGAGGDSSDSGFQIRIAMRHPGSFENNIAFNRRPAVHSPIVHHLFSNITLLSLKPNPGFTFFSHNVLLTKSYCRHGFPHDPGPRC